MATDDLRFIAFFLTQFHPTPENSAWWGEGFTEWTSTTRARPLFEGHYQPHLPADLGFYDLRLRTSRRQQIAMARRHGIDGFCYHYYWFSGRRLLHEPLFDMLADSASDMPFCLNWANESWSRRWNAAEHEVLLEQRYLPGDDVRFIEDAAPFLRDPRYLRIDGAPLLLVYRPQQMPDCAGWLCTWRDYARDHGLGELHLSAVMTHGNQDYRSLGFDSGVEFPPHNMQVPNVNRSLSFRAPFTGNVLQYADVAQYYLARDYRTDTVFRTVVPSWDNSARTGARATVLLNGTPANYESWLHRAVERTRAEREPEQRLVFINAWNEWAEGCHLEPDQRHGHGFLHATDRVRRGRSEALGFGANLPAETAPPTLGQDLASVLRTHSAYRVGALRMWLNRQPRLKAAVARLIGRGDQA